MHNHILSHVITRNHAYQVLYLASGSRLMGTHIHTHTHTQLPLYTHTHLTLMSLSFHLIYLILICNWRGNTTWEVSQWGRLQSNKSKNVYFLRCIAFIRSAVRAVLKIFTLEIFPLHLRWCPQLPKSTMSVPSKCVLPKHIITTAPSTTMVWVLAFLSYTNATCSQVPFLRSWSLMQSLL